MSASVQLPRGANLALSCQWTDTAGTPIDMTGVTLSPFEVKPAGLTPSISMTVTNAAIGQFSVNCPWSPAWPDGVGPLVSFRAKPSNGGPLSVIIPVTLV